jgi:glutaredoxin
MKITLYGKQGHAHTVAFKNFLRTSDVDFEYIDVMKSPEAKEHTRTLYDGALKFPTLFVEDAVYLAPTSDEFNTIMKDLKLRG